MGPTKGLRVVELMLGCWWRGQTELSAWNHFHQFYFFNFFSLIEAGDFSVLPRFTGLELSSF